MVSKSSPVFSFLNKLEKEAIYHIVRNKIPLQEVTTRRFLLHFSKKWKNWNNEGQTLLDEKYPYLLLKHRLNDKKNDELTCT